MNGNFVICALFSLTAFVGLARTAQSEAQLQPPVEVNAAAKEKPKASEDKKLTEPPKTDIFAQSPMMGPQFPTGFNPHMMGDFPGSFARQTITVVGLQTITTTTTTTITDSDMGTTTTTTKTTTATNPTSQTRTVLVPVGSLGAFKVAENASPRPQDRVFFTYHYYGDLRGPGNANGTFSASESTTMQSFRDATVTANTSTSTIIPGLPSSNLHREVIGFEKTFLDGYASIELRVPCLQQESSFEGFNSRNVGDLTIIGKYAFVMDERGNVLSAGLALTVPTGPSITTIDGNLHSTLFQPWFGYIRSFDRFFVQGFHSLVIPTDSRDVTLLCNDVGLNLWLYRGESDRLLRFVVPSLECHVTTPLNHRDGNGPIFAPDLVVLTGGMHFGLFQNTTLSIGGATPLTGLRPFSIEGFVQLNLRF